MKAIGPTFTDELKVAGLLGLPFSWGADGALNFGEAMTPKQIAAVQAVYDAHDPARQPIPPKTLTDGDLASVLVAKGLITQAEVDAAAS